MIVPKKKSLLKTEKDKKDTVKTASYDIGVYRDKMKQMDKDGLIKGGGISAFNFFEILIEKGTSPKDAFKRIQDLVKPK